MEYFDDLNNNTMYFIYIFNHSSFIFTLFTIYFILIFDYYSFIVTVIINLHSSFFKFRNILRLFQ